jgi:hypothetical protein
MYIIEYQFLNHIKNNVFNKILMKLCISVCKFVIRRDLKGEKAHIHWVLIL